MTSLAVALRRPRRRAINNLDDYANLLSQFSYLGNTYGLSGTGLQTLYGAEQRETITNSLEGYARSAYASSGVVFAVIAVRAMVFSGVRFAWQRLRNGTTGDLYGTRDLALLDNPWPGGTTQDLLLRMEVDAALAGNSYWTRMGDELVRLRPDWVEIICAPRWAAQPNGGRAQVGYRRIGYAYWEGGIRTREPALFTTDEVAHYAPMPDPLASYRGMSWLQPVIAEITSDRAMTRHRERFYLNAATPQLAISLDKAISYDQFAQFIEKFRDSHEGIENAYKTLFLGGGADVKVVGVDFKAMDFSEVQGRGEAMIAAAAGVPAVIAGLVKGIEASTYSNFSQARRRFADGTLHPLWANAAGSLSVLVRRPVDLPGTASRLWYDPRDVPFLREDRQVAADIEGRKAATMRQLIDAGFDPETVVVAVNSEDLSMLRHTGLVSVQLLPPGTTGDPPTPTKEAS